MYKRQIPASVLYRGKGDPSRIVNASVVRAGWAIVSVARPGTGPAQAPRRADDPAEWVAEVAVGPPVPRDVHARIDVVKREMADGLRETQANERRNLNEPQLV